MSDTRNNNILITQTAKKLGIKDPRAVKKCEEYLRILNTKSFTQVSSIAQIVLCLDLATSVLGVCLDKETAIGISALKKKNYQSNYNTIEKLLDLDKQQTVSEVCVQMSCIIVKELAESIFETYKIHHPNYDFTHPQYVVAAVFTACKLKKLKIEDIVPISRLKNHQWKDLARDFEIFVTLNGLVPADTMKKKTKAGYYDFLDASNHLEVKASNASNENASNANDSEVIEDYEVWKERILREARAALKLHNV